MSSTTQNHLATQKVIWLAMVLSIGLYVVVAFVVGPSFGDPVDPDPILVAAFAAVAVATGLGSWVFRRVALAGPIAAGELDPARPDDLARIQTVFIANLALSEAVGFYGLVLTMLSGEPALVLPFAAGALALFYVHRPTAPDLAPPPERFEDSTPIR